MVGCNGQRAERSSGFCSMLPFLLFPLSLPLFYSLFLTPTALLFALIFLCFTLSSLLYCSLYSCLLFSLCPIDELSFLSRSLFYSLCPSLKRVDFHSPVFSAHLYPHFMSLALYLQFLLSIFSFYSILFHYSLPSQVLSLLLSCSQLSSSVRSTLRPLLISFYCSLCSCLLFSKSLSTFLMHCPSQIPSYLSPSLSYALLAPLLFSVP